MKLQFIVGRSGTGKTHAILDMIAVNERAGRRSILIVPDRATFATERALSDRLGGGILYTAVLSFTSLARRVLDETGSTHALLSSQGRQMLVRRTVEENASELTTFSRVARRRGFSEECDEMILRCKRFSITPQALLDVCAELPAALAGKLRDFALIYDKTLENMEDKYIDSEDLVNSLIARLPQSSLRGQEVFIDAPDTMSEQSFRIIAVLIKIMSRVTVTLRIDTSEFCRDRRLFTPDNSAFQRIRDIAQEMGAKIEFTALSEQRRLKSPALRHLERELFAYPARRFVGSAQNIELHTAGSRLREVKAAAEELRSAARNGMRYRDMSVIVSDPEGYANIIRRVFRAYEIPFFMDVKRSVCSHPVSELLLSALRCAEKGFSRTDLLHVIKTGLTDVSSDMVEKLENFILKYGLNGKRLTEKLTAEAFPDENGLEQLELARRIAIEPLMELRERLGGLANARQRVEALFDYMQRLKLAQRLKEKCESLAKAGQEELARENAQVYDTVVELLDQLHIILGDDRIGLTKFRSVVEEGLKSYSVGVIPSTLDSVFVGDVDKSSVQRCRFLQVLGVNNGRFPKTKSDNSVINDADLARLKRLGLPVWDSTERMNQSEHLRVYSALCMAEERLRLSFCVGSDEEDAAPSQIIERVSDIFPDCKHTNGVTTPICGSTNAAAFTELTSALRRMIDAHPNASSRDASASENEGCTDEIPFAMPDDSIAALYAHFADDEEYAPALRTIDEALFGDNSPEPLGQSAAIRLYGRHTIGTPTRLETFNRCPFRYYLQFGHGLRERAELKERGTERGSLIHDALDLLLKSFIEEDADFAQITEEDVATRLNDILPPLMGEHNNGIFLETALMRAEFRRIAALVHTAGYALIRQIASGKFRPVGGEVGFGRRDDAFPPLDIISDTGEHFLVCGIVDRLDSFKSGDSEYIRIIDYKSYNQGFNFTELSNGLRLQLPLYAAAMEAALTVEHRINTAGMYYVYIGEPAPKSTDPEKLLDQIQRTFALNGLTLNDAEVLSASDAECSGGFSKMVAGVRFTKDGGVSGANRLASATEMRCAIEYAKRTAAHTLSAIMRGRAEISPALCGKSASCANCPYISVCRFDPTAGGRYRYIRSITADEFFKRGRTEE